MTAMFLIAVGCAGKHHHHRHHHAGGKRQKTANGKSIFTPHEQVLVSPKKKPKDRWAHATHEENAAMGRHDADSGVFAPRNSLILHRGAM
jgi:hypothetical protein